MKFSNEITPTALRSGFVAPTLGGPVAGVCPQAELRVVDGHTQVAFPAVRDAGMATGHRPWSPLIT